MKTINSIERQKNAFIQRDLFQFEITENIVPERHLTFIKNRIVDKNRRNKNRNKGRDKNRNKKRNKTKKIREKKRR